nr:asparagine synthase (glutamine-hydrolyzing) [Salinibacter ruber]
MCGIVGCYGDYDMYTLKSMMDMLRHRGPDASGAYASEKVKMGMRRLSIIDIQGGGQPMSNKKNTVHVVFNGEIYNYQEVKRNLKDEGYSFSTECDTEVLVPMWEEYGDEMTEYIDGMFAFSIYDEEQSKLFISRDPLGIKPLYYSWDSESGSLVWASEIRPLMETDITKEVDQKAVYNYFTLKYSPSPGSFFSNISKLSPGCSLTLSSSGLEKKRYWRLEKKDVPSDRDKVIREVRKRILEAVEKRMMADVPVGAFLSGGLDSTTIVALMSEYSTDRVNTYSIGFKQDEYDESDQSDKVAKRLDTNHVNIRVDSSSMDWFSEAVSLFGEPLADTTVIPSLLLSKAASEDVKVVQSGAGADELFAGYSHHRFIPYYLSRFGSLPNILYGSAEYLSSVLPLSDTLRRKTKRFASLRSHATSYLNWWTNGENLSSGYLDTELSDRELIRLINRSAPERDSSESGKWLMDFETSHYLPDDLLYKLDHTTMSASIEGRVPFLDKELVELAYSIPHSHKIDGRYKPILRQAIGDLVPDFTLSRSKQQFAVPVGRWFRNGTPEIEGWLTHSNITDVPYLSASNVFDALSSHKSGRQDNTSLLWRTLCYVAWYHEYCK